MTRAICAADESPLRLLGPFRGASFWQRLSDADALRLFDCIAELRAGVRDEAACPLRPRLDGPPPEVRWPARDLPARRSRR